MIHEVVDIERWKRTFPLEAARRRARDVVRENPDRWLRGGQAGFRDDGDYVHQVWQLYAPLSSPFQLALFEQLRDERLLGGSGSAVPAHQLPLLDGMDMKAVPLYPEVERVPTDVFLYGRGEPARREVTKIGGLPYWPARRPRPHTRAGSPMTFVFQFCFADSRDIVGDLPGDVLLYFSEDILVDWDDDGRSLFEWMTLGETDLIEPGALPETPWKITPVYGAIYRTYDYPKFYEDQEGLYWLGALNGTKIGGQPFWIQWPHDEPVLCTCGSVAPRQGVAFPYVNVEGSLTAEDEGMLAWGDWGNFYVFRPDGGRVWGIWDCY